MKNTTLNPKNYALLAALLFCAAGIRSVQAATLVTFQVDMTAQVQGGTFKPATDTVWARGSFNGWGNFVLTNNPSGSNTNLYTGMYNDTADANGAQLDWKFATSAIGYETTANGPNDNRATILPANGGSLVLPVEWFSDAGSPVVYPCVFQVNMAQQIALGTFNPGADTVEVQGDFEGWTSGYTLTNDPSILTTNQYGLVSSNVYIGTYDTAGSPGQVNEFKYVIQPTGVYEFPSALNGVGQNNNRFVFVESNVVTPIVYFSDAPYAPIVTNNFTFSVDMTVQALSGILSNQQVRLSGNFNNWDTSGTVGNLCTNNPNASNPYIYYSTPQTLIGGAGTVEQFKFGYVNGSWENNPDHTYPGNPSVLLGNNRSIALPSVNDSNLALPTVYFNDQSPNAVLPAPTTVTFSVSMTNAVGTDGHVFNPAADSVYLNGVVLTNQPSGSANPDLPGYAFAPWTNSVEVPGQYTNLLANFLMQNNPPGSEIYTIQVPIPAGYPVEVSYQYGINGNADEALNFTNHVRYIRSTGNYVMPLDKFGSMVQEESFGNLAIGSKSGANVPISWLGRPGVHLQVSTNLAAGVWTDLPDTEAQSATNYPAGAAASYFRLINPF
jgi:hypothetical protein